jgi:hypothetical protein
MEGCGPCNMTRPEWNKLKNVFKKSFVERNDIGIVSIDKDLMDKIKYIKKEPTGFPTIWYITNKGEFIENYEDSDIEKKDRSIDSFVDWIKLKTNENNNSKTKSNRIQNGGKTKKNKRRWSLKYKKSINCRKPKGFSQKQYCKYGRK